ncbi:hypothetical protein A2115_00830 [Candidatus Woesebacteria bacterium GWA1_41_8]|uniref:Uncharacterized protein n=1 Tax=Candidatus Woesebacteria bacterium GWA1_41_8 TaxID=1802471 RepID=A0A1F7WI86_9BACT|nr:MAG: hypothetical protein A2115_00830 [Candidatus Woesebacteria bacterium GWA1_41_8]
MSKVENTPSKQELNPFDMLVASFKKVTERSKQQGRSSLPTPEIDRYLEEKRGEAGSPPPEQRSR